MIEQNILGCMLKDNSLILETQIKPSYFSNQAHQLIFTSMLKLAHEEKAIDKISLISDNYQYLSDVGGVAVINEIEALGKVVNFETYEKQLIDQYKQRQSKVIASRFLNGEMDANEMMDELEELGEIGIEEEETVIDILEQLHNMTDVEQTEAGVKTNLSQLDGVLGGFQKQNSYIIGARPSIGKSATMLKFALSAIDQGVVPIIFSLEMSKESLLRRLIATVGNINLFLSNNPYELSQAKKDSWKQAVDTLKAYRFEIYDQSAQTIEFMRAKVRQAKAQYNKDVIVFIDYLTLIHSEKQYQSEHLKVGAISKALKNMAKTYDCPVVTLAQLSRSLEQRQDKRPMLSDLRESGSIEEDADGVMFLYRDSYYNKESDDNTLEINLAKNRNGPTGTAKVYYQKETGRMGDLANEY